MIDLIFYGRQLNDLVGVMGFVLVLVGTMMQEGQSARALSKAGTKTGRALISAAGIVVVAIHPLVKWKVLGG